MTLTTDEHDKLLLSRLQLFRNVDLDNQALLDLLSQCEYRQLQKGEVILSTEEDCNSIYCSCSYEWNRPAACERNYNS